MFSDTCVTKRTYIQILLPFPCFVKRVQIQWAAHLTQPMLTHVGIPLSRLDAAVSQQLLNVSDIHAILQQVRGEGVAQTVNRGLSIDARLPFRSLEETLGRPLRYVCTRLFARKQPVFRSAHRVVHPQQP